MAKKKMTKKTQKKLKKTAKKYPVLVAIVIILMIALVGCYFLNQKGIIHIPFFDKFTSSTPKDNLEVGAQGGAFSDEDIEVISNGDLSVHFLEVGNAYTGDCTLIKVGDTEVLIDAGSRKNSAATIVPYIEQFCTDGKLEFVIATHAHQDHIAGFIGSSNGGQRDGVFYSFEIGTLIQFTQTNLSLTTEKGNETLYGEYVKAVEYLEGKATTVYTVLECWNNQNGAKRSYTLGEGITMNFLYQDYYETQTNDENDYSVCMLLTEGENNYLFTGDLEHKGEKSLVQKNALPQCVLYKGGHHGSPTSSTTELLEIIQPDIVCVCCCCGSDEYTKDIANMFPSQAFVDRIAPYTDQVYVTTVITDDKGYTSMNGNIVVYIDNGEIKMRCSNNAILFKDTDWFKKNRTCPTAWK